MAGIVFYFEHNDIDVYSGRGVDLTAWNNLCKSANIKKAIIINRTEENIVSFDFDMDIKVVTELPELEGVKAQLVCPWDTTPEDKISLWDFDHKVDWYLFGPASGWTKFFSEKYVTVPQFGVAAAHALHVASTIMYHRHKIINIG